MTPQKKTIEQQVADAILDRDVASIEIEGQTYEVGSPSIATLILISEIISTLPVIEPVDKNDATAMVNSVLHHAKDFGKIGEIAAILILGARNLTCERQVTETTKHFFGLVRLRKTRTETVDMKAQLARQILYNVRPSVLWDLILKRLNMLELGDFFAITTSLSEANVLKPTRGVVQ